MNKISKKNGKIELLRFIMAIIIVFHHSHIIDPGDGIFPRGSLAVEFFFLVSGYLMALKCSKSKFDGNIGKDTLCFVGKKYLSLQPDLWITEIIAFIVSLIVAPFCGLGDLLTRLFGMMGEGLLLRGTGFNFYQINPVTWYVSVMLISMLVLYPICRKYFDAFSKIIAPFLGFMLIGMLCLKFTTQTAPDKVIFDGYIYKGLVRGLAEICLGVFTFVIVEKIKSLNFTFIGKLFLSCIEILSYLLVFILMCYNTSKFDVGILFILMIAVSLSFSEQGLFSKYFNNKFNYFLGSTSLAIYLSHQFWLNLIPIKFKDYSFNEQLIIYLIIVLLCSTFVYLVSKFLRKYSKQINGLFIKN